MSTQTNLTVDDERVDDAVVDEQANSADVAGGGLLGAVGGGIVGALAGGPIGAVIGAVIGGGASAVAVDYVDHHDHDAPQSVTTTAPDPINAGAVQGDSADNDSDVILVEEIAPIVVLEEVTGIVISLDDYEDAIRERAYELWEIRGHQIGYAERDWLDAEREFSTAV